MECFRKWIMSELAKLKEMAGTGAIVGCKDRGKPDFQIWGAMSDLKCKKSKKMKK